MLGWLLGGAPLPARPGGVAGVLGALGSALLACAVLAGPDAGAGFVVGLALGLGGRGALRLAVRRGAPT